MNYCIIGYTIYENDIRLRRYAEALVKPGNRVEAMTLWNAEDEKEDTLNGVKIFHIQKRGFNEKNRFDYLFNIMFYFIKCSIVLTLRHFRYHYKVIHINNVPDFLVFTAIIPKIFGAKIILDIHDILPEFYCQKFNKSLNSFFAKSLFFLERISVRFADYVIVANDLWKEKLISRNKISKEKTIALLNYINLDVFKDIRRNPDFKTLRIIYPGHLSQHHGIDIAIEALALVKKEIPKVRLDIYVNSWVHEYRDFLEKQITKLGLNNEVHFHRAVKHEQLAEIYEKVTIGVVPKRPGIFSSEAFSTKIFDFMAAGIPTVASRTSIDEYYFDESHIEFFESDNPEDMAKHIIALFRNPQKMESLTVRGKEYVGKINWQTKKQLFLDIIDSLVTNK